MIGDVGNDARRQAVVGTRRTDEPFPFATYVALASARDHLGPVQVHARHLPYGVWWDRLRPTIELVRPDDAGAPDETESAAPHDGSGGGVPGGPDRLPVDGVWTAEGRFVAVDDDAYAPAAAGYRTGDGLF